jgi:hypothetical protein
MSLPCVSLHRALLATLALGLLPSAHASALRIITDAWGGNGSGDIAAGCTTYTPIPTLQAFFGGGGFRAVGGNVACGYLGVTSDQTAVAGPLLASQTLLPVPLDTAGSSFRGTASARASYGLLGVAAQGLLAGAPGAIGGTSAVVATSAAFFQDTLSASSPLVAPSEAGFVRYVFSLDGSLSSEAVSNGETSVQLNLRQSLGPSYGLGRIGALGSGMGTVTAIDSDITSWVLGPGSASGAGEFGSTLHVPFFGDVDLPMIWGNPWDVEVGLLATTHRSADASFMSSARLVDIQLFNSAHERIDNFSLSSASGTDYLGDVSGPVPVPVPVAPSWALLLLGLALTGYRPTRRRC